MPKCILFLAKLKGKGGPFLKEKGYTYELYLTCGVNINYYKSVHHLIPTRENREHPGNFQNKSIRSAFSWVSRYIIFLARLKRTGRSFLEGLRRGVTLWDHPQERLVVMRYWKSLPFCEIWNNPTPPLLFIRPPYK